MTFREKLKQEHPRLVGEYADPEWRGGCFLCPDYYGYEAASVYKGCRDDNDCRECWDRETFI